MFYHIVLRDINILILKKNVKTAVAQLSPCADYQQSSRLWLNH